MKAITVWSPWSELIAIGAKPYEFRRWFPPKSLIGQRIAIHTGARPARAKEIVGMMEDVGRNCLKPAAMPYLEKLWRDPSRAMLSHVVCTAVLGGPVKADQIVDQFGIVINDSDRAETFNWAWPMLDIEPLMPPIPARGAQGFWNWTP